MLVPINILYLFASSDLHYLITDLEMQLYRTNNNIMWVIP
jgi:hypothetical protein